MYIPAGNGYKQRFPRLIQVTITFCQLWTGSLAELFPLIIIRSTFDTKKSTPKIEFQVI